MPALDVSSARAFFKVRAFSLRQEFRMGPCSRTANVIL